MKRMLIFLFCGVFLLGGLPAQAFTYDSGSGMYEGPYQWDSFQKYMSERQKQDEIRGVSYMISGAVATLGGVMGYYSSEDSFSRGIYAIAQSIGVAAIGYGANDYWIGNEYNSFYYAVEGARLSQDQKVDLLKRFLDREKEQREKAKWIKIVTHSLIAAVNLYSASHEDDKNVKGVLQFLAGANVVIACSYAF